MNERHGTRWVVAKYVLLQVPSWLVVGCLLAAAVQWWDLSTRLAWVLFAAWLVKDAALFPVLRSAYEPGDEGGAAALVGSRAVANGSLDPGGYVLLGAERWRAELADGHAPLPRGAAVRVRAVRGLTLVVVPDPDGAS
jgi:membrane protein implicated in regulation of membrane protease activity